MALAKRPNRHQEGNAPAPTDERAIQAFIEKGNATEETKPKKAKKTAIMVYFDPDVLEQVDAAAQRKHLSRSAWLHLRALEALNEEQAG